MVINFIFYCLRRSASGSVRVPKKGHFVRHLTRLPHKMNQSHAASFRKAEQVVIMESYEEYLKYIYITAKSNTVAASKAKVNCRQKFADCVNS